MMTGRESLASCLFQPYVHLDGDVLSGAAAVVLQPGVGDLQNRASVLEIARQRQAGPRPG